MEGLQAIWNALRTHLEKRKHLLDEEIRSYPTPIPHCDAQFNHLYEQRTRLFQELQRMDALAEKSLTQGDDHEEIKEFLSSSPVAADEAEQTLRAQVQAELFKSRDSQSVVR